MGKRKEFEDAFGPATPDGLSRSELAKLLAEQVGLTLPYAEKAVRAIFDPEEGFIVKTLVAGGRVTLYGFGTFRAHRAPARKVYLPRTKEYTMVPEHLRATFAPGERLQEQLNEGLAAGLA